MKQCFLTLRSQLHQIASNCLGLAFLLLHTITQNAISAVACALNAVQGVWNSYRRYGFGMAKTSLLPNELHQGGLCAVQYRSQHELVRSGTSFQQTSVELVPAGPSLQQASVSRLVGLCILTPGRISQQKGS